MPDQTLEAMPEKISALMPDIRAELERLVRIPSVSFPEFDPEQVRRSGAATQEILQACGMETRLLEVEGAHPAVLGRVPPPDGAPTVLLYAHHDVQPQGPENLWSSPPFEPVERNGRLYGRGSSDDKAGIVMHAAAMRAWDGRPPVGVTVFVEGEEESSSEHLGAFLSTYGELLKADAVILADSGNWRTGEPALTISLRGIVACFIEIRTLDHAVHSGEYGGAIPDALSTLCRTLATLHDEKGNVAVAGLASGPADPLDLTEKELREWAGVRPGVRLIGDGNLTERMWTKPAISVLGIDAPRTPEASNQLVPFARAKVSMRIPPGQDAEDAMGALVKHLEANVPWGAEVKIVQEGIGSPFTLEAEGPAYDAMRRAMTESFGKEPVLMGAGGSIPFVAEFAKQFPKATLMLTGAGDPKCNAHSEDESVDLGDLEKSCLAEALFLGYLVGR
ncbi:MAG TPA: dipeptidase [Actinomycetota bacterium]|nr:dipeptidase [Actinomycetota bacterium]